MIFKKALVLVGIATLLCSCHNIDNAIDSSDAPRQSDNTQILEERETYVVEYAAEPVEPEFATAATVAPASAEIAPIAPQAPIAEAQPTVAPWHAMYINSYGIMPTRYQDKGPFLYSFDVSPEAASSPDNNLGPLDFFGHMDDDDSHYHNDDDE